MKLAALAAALVAVAVAATPAHAETGSEERKDPSTALLLSLGGTAASGLLIYAGAQSSNESGAEMVTAGVLSSLVTPALGHWYAGEYFTWGTGMRLGGGALFLAGAAQALGCWENCGEDEGAGLILGGLGLYVGGALLDIATAPSAATKWNEHHLHMAPQMISTGASTTMGVGLGGTF